MKNSLFAGMVVPILALRLLADGPSDNVVEKVRPIPPPGIVVSEELKSSLKQDAEKFSQEIKEVFLSLTNKPHLQKLSPDVEIYQKAVAYAVEYNEFYKTNELDVARSLLAQGRGRLSEIKNGQASWLNATGLVVRGYRSRIDDSVQPYGLIIPAGFSRSQPHSYRLDFWFHGRGETLTELAFINERQKSFGEFAPSNAIVLHPYGRYCNGSKFAGETDAFEALEATQKDYPIDDRRIVVRGFSLGGASCWHMAVHHAGRWAAAAPGAGFSETPDFLKVFQSEKLQPSWFEQKLWRWYNATDSARNLLNCPTVAYSGEIDKQKQAADMMAEALALEGVNLVHIIGPKTAHKYHPESKLEINRRIDLIVAPGRKTVPSTIDLTTYTLRYNQMAWVTIDALDQHWEKANVKAEIVEPGTIRVTTKNVRAFSLDIPPGGYPFNPGTQARIFIDGRELTGGNINSDFSWAASFARNGKKWSKTRNFSEPSSGSALKKIHGLQGPVDDAFMDSFMMVRPTGKFLNETTESWTVKEMDHARKHWRSQFRGDARIKNDTEITDEDLAAHNLVLWGDPSSNLLLKKIVDRLPVKWTADTIEIGSKKFSSGTHLPALIYPNPLNPKKYVVLNSSFTFREYDYLNNARQTPKLPDFAIYDISSPVTARFAAKVVEGGFFNEEWQLEPGKNR